MKSRYIFATTVGLNLVGGIIAGLLVGWGFDWAMENWFGVKTAPWGLMFFFFIGIIAGFKNAYVDLKKIERELKSSEEKGEEDSQ
ncbi:AtpZ/AtpI family protein [Aquifex sp.]